MSAAVAASLHPGKVIVSNILTAATSTQDSLGHEDEKIEQKDCFVYRNQFKLGFI